MRDDVRPGFYKDKAGKWQVDRRSGVDRRQVNRDMPVEHERRKMFRRQVDREQYEREHKIMIEDALADFAEEHDGHL